MYGRGAVRSGVMPTTPRGRFHARNYSHLYHDDVVEY